MTVQLPIEIVENIIAFLHDDKSGLSLCSLICKEWLPPSRHHLFGDVFLLESNFRQFALLLGEQILGSYSLEHFIEALHVNTSAKRFSRHCYPSYGGARLNLDEIMPQLSYLHALKSLRLSYTSLLRFHILQLLSSFPLLEEIYIDVHSVGQNQPDLSPSDIRKYDVPRGLRVVDLWWCTTSPIVDWIHSQEEYAPPNVQILSLRSIASHELQSIGVCLRALGSSLLELVLDFGIDSDIPSWDPYIKHINLIHNTELRSITIFNFDQDNNGRYASSTAAVPRILSSISSSHIETIALILSATVSDVLKGLDCRLLDTIVKRSQLGAGRTLRFELLSLEEAGTEDLIRDSLPMCEAQGILKIERERAV